MRKYLTILLLLFSFSISAATIKNFTINTTFNSIGVETKMKMKWHNLPIGRLGLSSTITVNYVNDKDDLNQRFFRMADLHAYFNVPNDIVKFDFIYKTNMNYYNDKFKNQNILFNVFAGNIEGIPLCFDSKIEVKGHSTVGYKSEFQIKSYYNAEYNGWKMIPEISYGLMNDEISPIILENYLRCKFEVQKDIQLSKNRTINVFSNASVKANFYRENSFIRDNDASTSICIGIKF